jgi:hypothetical protein
MAEERCVRRCEICDVQFGNTAVVNCQGGKQVMARSIGPSPADQTENFERFLVTLNTISDGRDKFLGKIFASRHGDARLVKAIT